MEFNWPVFGVSFVIALVITLVVLRSRRDK